MSGPNRKSQAFLAGVAFLAFAIPIRQSFGQGMVSAMGGYIHHTEGEVFLADRPIHPKPTEFLLVLDGQRLRTGDGRAEVMLTPGGFLRLGHNSEIEMIAAGLGRSRLRVTQGSAIVHMLSIFEKDSVAVLAGDGEVQFPRPGLYRVNAGDPEPELKVFNGKAVVLSGDQKRDLKGKQVLALSHAGDAEIEKFNPKEKDPLDEWNETRAEALGKIARDSRKNGEGMDPLYREWLELTMRKPMPTYSPRAPESRSPQPSQQSGGKSSPRGR